MESPLDALVADMVNELDADRREEFEERAGIMEFDGKLGLAALAILACGWIYRLINWKRESQGGLFPWVTSPGRLSLVREIRQFLLLRWTKIPEDGALVGTIHGMGLLITSAMVLTGGVLYVALAPQDTVTPLVKNLMGLHSFLSTFMWAYLCGHALMALWHHYMGHGSLSRIFKL